MSGTIYMILPEELTKRGFIHQNVEATKLKPIIERVQRNNMKVVLGGVLYRTLLEQIQTERSGGDVMPAAYRLLMEDYILPALVPMIEKRATVHLNWEMRNKNIGAGSDEFRVSNNRQETADLQSDFDDDIAQARNELVRFLKANREIYPEYEECTEVDLKPEGEEDSTSGGIHFVHGGKITKC